MGAYIPTSSVGSARSALVRASSASMPGVVRRGHAAVDHAGARLRVRQRGDDHQLVGVGDDDPLDGVGVVGRPAQHGRGARRSARSGTASPSAPDVSPTMSTRSPGDHAVAAQLARLHGDGDALVGPVRVDQDRVPAPVHGRRPAPPRRRRARGAAWSGGASPDRDGRGRPARRTAPRPAIRRARPIRRACRPRARRSPAASWRWSRRPRPRRPAPRSPMSAPAVAIRWSSYVRQTPPRQRPRA